ncbi:MAG: type II secretion system protein [Rhodospirillaceae bacterium]|jgi:prepilin-type N-terminal cleavage/methylation domain-containing protein
MIEQIRTLELRLRRGFTLIEAIVAVAIIGMTTLPIMLLISESLTQLSRAADASSQSIAMESILALIDPINPLSDPSGAMDMGSYSFEWNSTVLVTPNDTIQTRTGLAGYKVGFYNVEVNVQKNDDDWFNFNVRKVGYERFSTSLPFADTE